MIPQIGDVVRKNSGGPKMDVDAIADDTGHLRCSWIDKEGNLHSEMFPPETLAKVEKWVAPQSTLSARRR
ncbi:DUF2158 domain-containing protein [Hyphomicrobium sp. xq]|uniref:DUF2158 domain-containing protein n=1 Tax=Hyphomicrobium album TaxID=2665159 RepID=A0A6I3KJ28_9HYPH|nr:DUF2158 domain-containing protein [Hyphomicrobium album]MTD93930.1 DUF2158 domain-containing protein [Hyphomicrobium album]